MGQFSYTLRMADLLERLRPMVPNSFEPIVREAIEWDYERDDELEAFLSTNLTTGSWTAFVPTLSGGWVLGNSTYTARYAKDGTVVRFAVAITIGSSATKGSGLTMALPVTANATDGFAGVRACFVDTGTAEVMASVSQASSGLTSVVLYAVNASTTYAQAAGVTATVPFTWATGDKIFVGGTYEAAA